MSEALELSKRLEQCANWLERDFYDPDGTLKQWAADIRSLIIPQPGERDETTNTYGGNHGND